MSLKFIDLLEQYGITTLAESSKTITVYHGDNFKTTKLDPKYMNTGNNQEGIGIYFGSLAVAKDYGSDIVSTEVDKSKFVYSRNLMKKYVSNTKIAKLLKELYKLDVDEMYSFIIDYGVEVYEPEDINSSNLKEFAVMLSGEQVRNFQIDLAQRFGVNIFVKLWNDIIKIDGTFNDEEFYCIINTKYKLTKV